MMKGLCHKANLTKPQQNGVIQTTLSDSSAIKFEVKHKKIDRKPS